MEQILEYILKNITKHPNDIEIEKIENISSNDSKFVTYQIKVNQEDLPIVVGKQGRTIKSIQNLIKVKAIKENQFVDLKLKRD